MTLAGIPLPKVEKRAALGVGIVLIVYQTRRGRNNMKIMIASDIHGSAKWCRMLMERFQQEEPRRLLLLGDLLYHGPRNDLPEEYAPKKVAQMLNEVKEKLICIQGNCDSQVDQMLLDFPIEAASVSLLLDDVYVYASHGHLENPENPPALAEGDVLLNGHTHVAKYQEYDGFIYVNPGSVSIPKEGTPRGYVIYEDETFYWKTLQGEIYMEHTVGR